MKALCCSLAWILLSHVESGYSATRESVNSLLADILRVDKFQVVENVGNKKIKNSTGGDFYTLLPAESEEIHLEWWTDRSKKNKEKRVLVKSWDISAKPNIEITPLPVFSQEKTFYFSHANFFEKVINYGFYLFLDDMNGNIPMPGVNLYWNLELVFSEQSILESVRKLYPDILIRSIKSKEKGESAVVLDSFGFSSGEKVSPEFWIKDLPWHGRDIGIQKIASETKGIMQLFNFDYSTKNLADSSATSDYEMLMILKKIPHTLDLTHFTRVNSRTGEVFSRKGDYSPFPKENMNIYNIIRKSVLKGNVYMHVNFLIDGEIVNSIYWLSEGKINLAGNGQ